PATSTCTSSPSSHVSAISARRARAPRRAPRVACPRVARRGALRQPTEPEHGRATPDALPLTWLDRDGHARAHVGQESHFDRVDTERLEWLVQHDLRLVDLDLDFLRQRVGDLLRGDAPERLPLPAGFELEHERHLVEPPREILRVAVRAVALGLRGFALLGEMLELAAGRLDGQALRPQVVAGVPVG